jgi:phage terminase large subunit-like protein
MTLTISATTRLGCVPKSIESSIALANSEHRRQILENATAEELREFHANWLRWARDEQVPPADDWTTWLILGGRGAGKTRAGAEWVRSLALRPPCSRGEEPARIALIGETLADVREVMIGGPSGLLSLDWGGKAPRWIGMRRCVELPNGAVAFGFSSEDPESLRGPQFSAAWCDELAKWKYPDATWDMLQFGLRLGARPRQVVTTTPRPIPLLKRLIADRGTIVSRTTTDDNWRNLAPAFLDAIVARYRGTRLGRQELDAELIEERPDALWHRPTIEACRVASAPELTRIVIGVDPPAGSGDRSAACGIVAAGIDRARIGYVLADATAGGLTPARWARRVVDLYHRLEADRIIAEVNQGGDMVEAVIRQADAKVPVLKVTANRGKLLRAEPVAALYEKGEVKHVGAFPALEDEMCDLGLGGLSSGRSPDRVDALVWALSALMLGREAEPRVRTVGE